MRYLSVCSGIEAASVAWHPLGWEPVAFSEIEPFPSAVLAHRFPNVPNMGDMTRFKEWNIEPGTIDLLVGGTPCQSFSVAGLRKGLDDPRGNLMLTFGAIADHFKPTWIVWENVPGVLSSNGGRDFGTFLGMLGELGYGFAYRVLDAQYFGVPQRRRRVFVVGHLGDWRRAASVLFESESLRGNPPPSRKTWKGTAFGPQGRLEGGIDYEGNPHGADELTGPLLKGSPTGGGHPLPAICFEPRTPDGHARLVEDGLAPTLNRMGGGQREPCVITHAIQAGATRKNPSSGPDGVGVQADVAYTLEARAEVQMIAHILRGRGFDASEDGTGRGTPLVPVPFDTTQITSAANYSNPKSGDPCHPLASLAHPPAIAFSATDNGRDAYRDVSPTLRAMGSQKNHPNGGGQVAVAFAIRGREGGAMPEVEGDQVGALRSASGGSSRSFVAQSAVRRLTPRECERLQGFPDDWTLIPWGRKMAAKGQVMYGKMAPDGPRYKACGNSMAVPVMAWIGKRIDHLDAVKL